MASTVSTLEWWLVRLLGKQGYAWTYNGIAYRSYALFGYWYVGARKGELK